MEKQVSLKDHNSVIELHLGDHLKITLAENGTTGYLWHYEGDKKPGAILLSSDFEKSTDGLGASGKRVILWEFTKPGKYILKYVHKQAWNPEIESTFELTIGVS
jgi:predicted secreted protein